ncbi:MAG: MgtC/SapB family protein [Rubrobacteraceae bacterium]
MEELTISYTEVALRLAVTVLLCGAVGFERETRDQSAGFRTHILLGLGAALFTLVSAYGFPEFTEAALEADSRGVVFDPTRIAAQIVTGIGFLGAGAIIRQGLDIRGLTTAASLWTVAAIGMAAGAGYLFGAFLTTIIVLLALYLLRIFRGTVIERFRTELCNLIVTFEDSGESISEIVRILESRDMSIRATDAEVRNGAASYDIQLRIPPDHRAQEMLREVAALPGVERVRISGLQEID